MLCSFCSKFLIAMLITVVCLDVAVNISENWTVQRQQNYPFSSIACDQGAYKIGR